MTRTQKSTTFIVLYNRQAGNVKNRRFYNKEFTFLGAPKKFTFFLHFLNKSLHFFLHFLQRIVQIFTQIRGQELIKIALLVQ